MDMDINQIVPLIPLASFWACFAAVAKACEFAHQQKEKLLGGGFSSEYTKILRKDTLMLCIGVVFALLVFTAILGWLGWTVWCQSRIAGILIWFATAWVASTALMFSEGTLRFFRQY